jgi:hypothetical protein
VWLFVVVDVAIAVALIVSAIGRVHEIGLDAPNLASVARVPGLRTTPADRRRERSSLRRQPLQLVPGQVGVSGPQFQSPD